ncbi:MAG TPA: serine hydrolase [Chitinophagaceae bacterium]
MKRSAILFFIILHSWVADAQSLADKLDEYLSANARLGKFNGVAFVARRDTIILHKGYGWRNAEKRIAHDVKSVFQIGSVTKQFTSAAILRLQEQGKLSVKDTIGKYFPGFPNGGIITIEHLLTHTSGIYNYTNDNQFMSTRADKPITMEKMLELFRDKPLDFAPGFKWSYSNSGYILLGYIISKVSGKSYEQYVRDLIFTPLRMENSGFDFKSLTHPAKSVGYFVLNGDTLRAPIVDSSVSYAAGAIYSTASDLYKWHKSLYTDKVIKQASLEKAFTPFKSNYGYGWIIVNLDGKKLITHGGGIFGFTADILRVPSDDICIILLVNKPENINTITLGLYDIMNNKPVVMPKERPQVKLAEDVLKKYTGEYELTPAFKIVVTLENGKLKGQATGQSKFELFPEREDFFFLKVVDAQLEFIKGSDGSIQSLILHQGGMKQKGVKIK